MDKPIIKSMNPGHTVHETYYETKIGKTLYRVTSVYLGKIDFGKALEDLTVRKVLKKSTKIRQSNTGHRRYDFTKSWLRQNNNCHSHVLLI